MSAGEEKLISHTETISDQLVNDVESLILLPENEDQGWRKFSIAKSIFHTILTANYILLLLLLIFHVHNACHMLSWLASFCAITYMSLVFYTLLFSEQLCFHSVDYVPMKGSSSNLLPSKINIHYRWPYDTICHIAHVRGSTIHKWHTTLIGYGSLFMWCIAMIQIFEAHNTNGLYNTQQIVAMYLLLIATSGGILLVNFEIYASPSFSKRWNCMTRTIHLFGGTCYAILGNLSFALYNNFNFMSCLLLFSMLMFAVVYKVHKGYQYKKNMPSFDEMIENELEEDEYGKWVHRMSQINVGLEVMGLFIAVICMNWLGYQLGDHAMN